MNATVEIQTKNTTKIARVSQTLDIDVTKVQNPTEMIEAILTVGYEAMVKKAEEFKVGVSYVADTDQKEYYELMEKHGLIHSRLAEITNFG